MEIVFGIVGAIVGVVSLCIAWKSHKRSLHAPILDMRFMDPSEGKPFSKEVGATLPLTVAARREDYENLFHNDIKRDEIDSGIMPQLSIRNAGNKTARDLRLRGRYSVLLRPFRLKGSKEIDDPDKPMVKTIEHPLGDLHPGAGITWVGDLLIPRRSLFDGVSDKVAIESKDGKNMSISYKVELAASVEFILYSEDSAPLILEMSVQTEPRSEQDGAGQPPAVGT